MAERGNKPVAKRAALLTYRERNVAAKPRMSPAPRHATQTVLTSRLHCPRNNARIRKVGDFRRGRELDARRPAVQGEVGEVPRTLEFHIGLFDQLIVVCLYRDWRDAAAEVSVAYERSCGAWRDSGLEFAAYRAALDREEAAARLYAAGVKLIKHACAERPLRPARPSSLVRADQSRSG